MECTRLCVVTLGLAKELILSSDGSNVKYDV